MKTYPLHSISLEEANKSNLLWLMKYAVNLKAQNF